MYPGQYMNQFSESVIMIYLPHKKFNYLDPNYVDYASLELHDST